MTIPLLPRTSSWQARRVERFVARQQFLQQRQRKSLLRNSALLLLGIILVIRLAFERPSSTTPSPPLLNVEQKAAVAKKKSPENSNNKEQEDTDPEILPPEDDPIRGSEIEIGPPAADDEESPREPQPPKPPPRTKKRRKKPRLQPQLPVQVSPKEAERMLQSQTSLYHEARQAQQQFCQEWKARLTAPSPDELPPLVPAALEQVVSLFNDDESYWMEVYPENDIVSGFVLDSGAWEKEKTLRVAQWCRKYAQEHDNISLQNVTFVDIGANVGWYTLALADLGVNVIAIEPLPANVELLRRSLCRNPRLANRITIYALGLSTVSNRTCHMYSDKTNVGDGHTYCAGTSMTAGSHAHEKDPFVDDERYVKRATVPLRRLDDVIGNVLPHHRHIAALKMDTEGYEAHVVRGGPVLFGSGRIPHVQSEYNPEWIRGKGESPLVMLSTLFRAGYRVRRDVLTDDGDSEPFLTRAQALNVTTGAPLTGLNDIMFEKLAGDEEYDDDDDDDRGTDEQEENGAADAAENPHSQEKQQEETALER